MGKQKVNMALMWVLVDSARNSQEGKEMQAHNEEIIKFDPSQLSLESATVGHQQSCVCVCVCMYIRLCVPLDPIFYYVIHTPRGRVLIFARRAVTSANRLDSLELCFMK